MAEEKIEKKRKRHSGDEDRPRKRTAIEREIKTVKVSFLENAGQDWAPAIVTAPGLNLSSTLAFKPYKKARSSELPRPTLSGRSLFSTSELLLHSNTHPTLDYTAREQESGEGDGLLKHYIGVYEPTTGELQVVQARKLVVRSTLRSDASTNTVNGLEEKTEETPSRLSARSVLGQTFGTKKSQKAIRALTENAISSSPVKSSQDPSQKPILDPLTTAVIESMAQSSTSMASRADLQAAVDEGKPRPKPNFAAATPADVYTIENLVGVETLKSLNVKEWQDKVNMNEGVETRSLFVSRSLARVVKTGDIKRLKALKFLLLLIDWNNALKSGSRGTKKVSFSRDDVRKEVGPDFGDGVLDAVRKRFAPDGTLNKWAVDYLLMHICALALAMDNYEVDIYYLRGDLKLETKVITQYFRELGCAVRAPSVAERKTTKMTKQEGELHRIAKLEIPLDFPKQRVIVSKRK